MGGKRKPSTPAEIMAARVRTARAAQGDGNPGINPDQFGSPNAANVTFEAEQWFEKDDQHPKGGAWVKRRRGRRTNNVFDTLHKAGTLEQRQRVAGNYLATLYAQSQGLQGSPDDGFERVQCDAADPHEVAMRSAVAGRRFAEIIRRVEKPRYQRLLRALVRDIVLGDGAGNDADGGVRWRRVVATTLGLNSDKAQANAVKIATAGLLDIIEACECDWRETERLRAA